MPLARSPCVSHRNCSLPRRLNSILSLSLTHAQIHTHTHSVVEVCNLITVLGEGWPRAPATRFMHGILGGRAQLRRTVKLPLTFIHLTQLTLPLLPFPASFSCLLPPLPLALYNAPFYFSSFYLSHFFPMILFHALYLLSLFSAGMDGHMAICQKGNTWNKCRL